VKETVVRSLKEGAELRLKMAESMSECIFAAAEAIADAFKAGRKLLLFGNGGSAADAQHIAAEFMNRFLIERPPLVLKALRAAKKLGMITIALTGESGKAAALADIALQVPSRNVARIQEGHNVIGHILCELTDTLLFKDVGKR
jgi:D-sedoheptulose 7-phosphate isomerase